MAKLESAVRQIGCVVKPLLKFRCHLSRQTATAAKERGRPIRRIRVSRPPERIPPCARFACAQHCLAHPSNRGTGSCCRQKRKPTQSGDVRIRLPPPASVPFKELGATPMTIENRFKPPPSRPSQA